MFGIVHDWSPAVVMCQMVRHSVDAPLEVVAQNDGLKKVEGFSPREGE